MIGAGKRDRRIVFERATVAQDDYGEENSTWAQWAVAFAAVRFGTSAERREAAATQASQAATFRVLASAKTKGVAPGDRIVFDGAAWDIKGEGAPIGRSEIEFTAVRAA